MKNDQKYYDISDDLEAYPDALFMVIWSGRGVGKTYSALRYCIEHKKKFLFLKRTIEDVSFISAADNTGTDVSPFAPLNRDFGWNYKIRPIKGKNGFCTVNFGENDEVAGYVLAIASVHKVKGFELSDCDVIIYDEFIPQISESRINKREGDILLELQATVTRDRLLRGKPEVCVWLLANATSAVSPVSESLRLTDDIVEMSQKGIEYRYLKDRYILLHNFPAPVSMRKDSRLYAATRGTRWAAMAFDNEFAYNDFSKVRRESMKGAVCLASVRYNLQDWYIYQTPEGVFIVNQSRGKAADEYDMNIDGDRIRFWYEYGMELRNAVAEDMASFSSYSFYQLIMSYSKNMLD